MSNDQGVASEAVISPPKIGTLSLQIIYSTGIVETTTYIVLMVLIPTISIYLSAGYSCRSSPCAFILDLFEYRVHRRRAELQYRLYFERLRTPFGYQSMNSKEVELILNNFPITSPYYRACVAVDQLWENRAKFVQNSKNIFVVNTLPRSASFGHWLLLFFVPTFDQSNRSSCIFFDSYGRTLRSFDSRIQKFVKYFVPSAASITHNARKIQAANSCVCALYVTFFAVFLCIGYQLADILNWFSISDLHLNDLSVLRYLRKYLRLPRTDKLIACQSIDQSSSGIGGQFRRCRCCQHNY